jgi:predicted 3-demethylubiquinone-9 3-methyltransferase (glyoxalase superfamily)
MPHSVTPFLLFQGQAEEAINFYTSVIPRSHTVRLERYAAADGGEAGKVKRANIVLAGQPIMVIDSPVKHHFSFNPAVSFFVECKTEDEIRTLSGILGVGGPVLMPLDNYGFSKLFAWVTDRFGVTWQLNYQG